MLSFFCLNQRISIHYVVGKPVDCIVQFSVVGNYVKFRVRSNKKFFAIEHLLKILTHSLCYPGTKLTSIDKTMIPLAVFGVLAVLMTTGVECGKYFFASGINGKTINLFIVSKCANRFSQCIHLFVLKFCSE